MIALVLLLAGWCLIACSQSKQLARIARHRHLPAPVRTAMRAAGAALLVAALIVLIRFEGPSFGALIWACLLSLSAMAVAVMLAFWPRFTAPS